ncbi:ribokinase [Roseiarcus fermentans]|uniref:Ribokinase n=1 Tax=Roseiarcus fermentans TaxID=1473586 RepID=A0A366F9P6_9HYPH|nr:carbohydrate kinase family protein [Roseiarcus fermentans]RBP11384.1 ribokinase [Roseiarcus fermentans]
MNVAITGYASLDYALRLDRAPEADRTATILSRAGDFPRLGGSPAYVAAAMAAAGARGAAPITWVGDDADGESYRAALAALGLRTDGVGIRSGRTPVCVLAYQPDGGCCCLYHPSLAEPIGLDAAQRALVAAADFVCVTVGPEQATREALALTGSHAILTWAVKADPRAVPPDLAAALATRADIVVSSRGEADFVREAFARAGARDSAPLRIETRGGEGVAILREGAARLVPVRPVEAEDTTGAGDTFLGAFLAAWSGGDVERAVEAGARAARALLEGRAQKVQGT